MNIYLVANYKTELSKGIFVGFFSLIKRGDKYWWQWNYSLKNDQILPAGTFFTNRLFDYNKKCARNTFYPFKKEDLSNNDHCHFKSLEK